MSRSHGYRFANQTLPDTVFDNPLAFAQRIANQKQGLQLLSSIWDSAGARLSPADRVSNSGMGATLEQRGPFVVIHVRVPPPRENGDPCAIAIIGCGDGVFKLDAVSYWILELVIDPATSAASFVIVKRTAYDEQGSARGEGPAPDPKWFVDHVCELAVNRTPQTPSGTPAVPAWYWWYVFRGADAMRAWFAADDAQKQTRTLMREPILLLPEIADAADLFLTGGRNASSLRQARTQFRSEQNFGRACNALATQLAESRQGSVAANVARALDVVAEMREHADRAQANATEAMLRQKLAAAGIDVRKNHEAAQRLLAEASARPDPRPAQRLARGTELPVPTADQPGWTSQAWSSLFLDNSELPYFTRAQHSDQANGDPMFAGCGGLHAGYSIWLGQDSWPMWRIVDSRWLFSSAAAADQYLRAVLPTIGEGLPRANAPQLGDDTLAFAAPRAGQIIVFRVGRMVGKVLVAEGAAAAQHGLALDQSMILPFAARAAQRAQWVLSRYWLGVGQGNDAAKLFAQSPTARLISEYPILALPEFPAAMATLGDAFTPSAHALWNLQVQLRSQQWNAHRDATRALVRTLLDDRSSEPRVNVAHAHALVLEMMQLDADPIWSQLDAECRARA